MCEAPGQYAIRGGIIDVYPVTASEPYRLDFFGDEIEQIRAFDPVTQRSGATLEEVTISASSRVRLDPSKTGLADYLSPRSHLVFIEPATLDESLAAPAREDAGGLKALLEKCAAAFGVSDLDEASVLFENPEHEVTWDSESLVHHRAYPEDSLVAQERLVMEEEARRRFLRQVWVWQEEGYGVAFVSTKEGEEQRMQEILAAMPPAQALRPAFLRGSLNEGFRITFGSDAGRPGRGASQPAPALRWPHLPPDARGLVVVTETEVFGRQRQRRPALNVRAMAQRAQIDQLLDFSELVEGDFVVHLQHGIALYRGLTKLDTAQGEREVISLEFDDGVTLHVPLQESHLISRYVGLSKTKPQLGRIGSGRWEKARQAAERATLDLAAELLRIQAAREAQPGYAFSADTTWQKEFEASFPFTETPDQLRAIEETKADMEQTRPMDRLICGDVGFGKTEVAIRAAFKAVQGGRQVAMLVPTTVLAQQHLNTFRERMAGYPIAVEMISRFRSRQEQKKILAETAAGQRGHSHRHAPRCSSTTSHSEGARAGDHRRGAALRGEAQGGVQADAGDGRRAVDERHADSADAVSRPDRGARPQRHRNGAGQPAPDPDDRADLRREARGRRDPARDPSRRPGVLSAQSRPDDRPGGGAAADHAAGPEDRRRPRANGIGGAGTRDDPSSSPASTTCWSARRSSKAAWISRTAIRS